MKFLYTGKYRRQVLIEKPFKRLSKVSKIRNSQAKMQIDFQLELDDGIFQNIKIS